MKARGEQGQPSGAASDAEGSPIPSGTDQEQREETGKAHQEDAQEREPQQLEQRRQQAEAGPLTEFDPDDWFLPLELPFKRKSYRAKSKPRQWKRLRQILQVRLHSELADYMGAQLGVWCYHHVYCVCRSSIGAPSSWAGRPQRHSAIYSCKLHSRVLHHGHDLEPKIMSIPAAAAPSS